MYLPVTPTEAVGYLGAVFVIATYAMRTMIPLRSVGLASNAILLGYAVASHAIPDIVLGAIVLPLNSARLVQMIRLTRKVEEATHSDLSMDWLKPFMHRRTSKAGEVLFRKGDPAEEMFYTVSGHYRLVESGIELPTGEVVGELGLLAPEQRRTQTLECVKGGEMLVIRYSSVRELYYQNPRFGFFFLQLATKRLFQNHARLEAQLAQLGEASDPSPRPAEASANG
ncbi:MAG: cyclic nucleotide-binding domain-containing protein [Acetobacteraceae bacterium]